MNMLRKLALAGAFAMSLMTAPASAQQTLTFGGSDAVGSLFDRANAKFAELVNQRGGDKLRINYIQGEQLGNDIDVIQQMMQGSVQMYGDVLDWYGNWVPDFNVLNWGFTFRDSDHLEKFLASDLYAAAAERLRKEQGLRILSAASTQPRILLAKRAVNTPDDLNGIKMRVPEIRTYLLLWQALGTKPSRLAWAEIFLGLSTGTVEATEGPVSATYAAKLHQAAKFVMRTDHLLSTHHITINDAAYQALEPDLQEILVQAAKETSAWVHRQGEAETEQVVQNMADEGATVIKVDREPFVRKALEGVAEMEKTGVWPAGLWEKIRGL
jgi:TRAP-type transport system periplasmic protein